MPPKAVLSRVRKLAQIARDLSEGANFAITRLTTLKSLCEDPQVAAHFAVYLANHTSRRINEMPAPLHLSNSEWRMHNELVERAVKRLQSYVEGPSDQEREELRESLRELESVNDEYESIPYGVVRIIQDKNVLIVEDAVRCVLSAYSAASQAYHLARDYAERYDPRYGSGLIPESAPLVMDIVDFWCDYYSIDRDNL
jgi:O6-methylguanine-DNA--protein-cysteine methyltransferase